MSREYHISFSEIEKLPYYKYEWIVSDINEQQKKEEENQKRYDQQNSFKMPKIPKVQMPKF